jgi:hypothetical protein
MARYRPVGQPINRSEEDALRQLRNDLPENYLVIGNFELSVSQRRNTLEFDALVIGDYGIWAVEIKGWSGRITGDTRRWQLRWGRVSNPFIRIETKAKALRAPLVREVHGWPQDLVVISTVFLPDARVDVSGIVDDRVARLITNGGVHEFFVERARRACGGHVLIDDALKARIADALVPRVRGTPGLPVIPNYEIREVLDTEGLPYREYLGAHAHIRGRGRVRIKEFRFDPIGPRRELEGVYRRGVREMEALEALGPNPYVARAYEFIRELEDDLVFYVVLEWVSSETLGEWIETPPAERSEPMWALAYHLLRAVAFLHERGIVHKNLHPGVIRLSPDDPDAPIRIADFDFARMTNFESIDDELPTESGEGAYRSHELWMDEPYDARADVFSLGAILYAMYRGERLMVTYGDILKPGIFWEKRLARIDDPELRGVLTAMLSIDPAGRDGALDAALALCARRAGYDP